MLRWWVWLLLLISFASSGCVGHRHARVVSKGAVIGAASGAVVGARSGRAAEGALIGGAVGAAAAALSAPQPRARRVWRAHRHKYEEEEDDD